MYFKWALVCLLTFMGCCLLATVAGLISDKKFKYSTNWGSYRLGKYGIYDFLCDLKKVPEKHRWTLKYSQRIFLRYRRLRNAFLMLGGLFIGIGMICVYKSF